MSTSRDYNAEHVDNVDRLLGPDGQPMPPDYDQPTVMAQLSKAVFDNFTPGYYFVLAMTGIILVLAANTAFNGFPVLGSILAQDRYLPRKFKIAVAVIVEGGGRGSEANAPLARAVVGGLVSSTFLTLFVVPILYTLLNRDVKPSVVSSEAASFGNVWRSHRAGSSIWIN